MIDDHIALLPEDLTKQVAACRGVQCGLRAYQRELASLWAQGREIERDATDKERAETVERLGKLQAVFETAFHTTTQRLTDLEKALTSRKYFQVDLEKICLWLRRADAITFPEINFSNIDDSSELQTQLSSFQNVLEQASEYENLLLIVQRIGQEILPTLNEIDHCYLDERLNALPQQYNAILALAKEKKDRVQQVISERKEFSTFFDITRNALEELQEKFDNLEKQTINTSEEELVCRLINEYRTIEESLFHVSPAVRELHGKTEGFLSWGQQFRAAETLQLVNLHNSLKKINDEKIKHLDGCLKPLPEHKRVSTKLDSEFKSAKEKLVGLKSDREQSAVDRITNLYSLLESLDCVGSEAEECNRQNKGLGLKLDPKAFQETELQLESLQSLRCEVKRFIDESETVTKDEDFAEETEKLLEWLRTIKEKSEEPLSLSEVRIETVNEEVQKLKVVEEEVKSRLRIGDALGTREKQKYFSKNKTVPANIEEKLQEMAKLGAEVHRGISRKQVCLFIIQKLQS